MSGRRGGVRPRRADSGGLPRLQHEDGPLGQRARHPHLLLHRPEGLGVARMAGEGDPQIRRPALHHLPLRAHLFPETRHHARFRGQPARRRHRGPADDAPDARGVPPPQLPRPTPDRRPAGRQPPERDPRQPAANGRAVAKIPRAPVRGGGRRMARPGALRTIHSRKRHPLRLRPDLRDACGGRGGRGDVGHGDARNGPAGHSRSGGLPHGVECPAGPSRGRSGCGPTC